MSKEIADRYTGDHASDYDKKRMRLKRWDNENRTMRTWLKGQIRPTILDVPFGTGRWIEVCNEIDARVYAVDLSQDMLDEAESKLGEQQSGNYTFINKDIFSLNKDNFDVIDWLLCIRFLNWLDWPEAEKIIRKLSALDARNMVIGCSTYPSGDSYLARQIKKLRFAYRHRGKAPEATPKVHDSALLKSVFADCGWKIEKSAEINHSKYSVNHFYHLTR